MLVTVAAAAMSLLMVWALVAVGPTAAAALALLPLLAIGVVYIATSGQMVLWAAAIAIPFWLVPVHGGPLVGNVFSQDLVAVLALGALIFATLLGRGFVPPVPRTPVLGWPFVLFAVVILSSTLRGHYAYGASLVGQPLRLIIYAAIVAGLIGMTVPRMHRLLVILLYPGAVLTALASVRFLATGGSSTAAVLSTGGTRPLPITTSIFCASALFLALLKLRQAQETRDRLLHLTMAGVALFGVIAGFGRAVWMAVAFVCLVLFLTSSRLRVNALSVVPLMIPFLLLLAMGASHAAPGFVDSVERRVAQTSDSDINVRFRVEANRIVLDQVREQPVFGVGFGKTTELLLAVPDATTGIPSLERSQLGQDPHNGYLYFLAGGGIVALASFALLVAVFGYDVVRRYRATTDQAARMILLWTCATLFVFLFNAGFGTSFDSPANLLMIWALLVLPAIVSPEPGASVESRHGPRRGCGPASRDSVAVRRGGGSGLGHPRSAGVAHRALGAAARGWARSRSRPGRARPEVLLVRRGLRCRSCDRALDESAVERIRARSEPGCIPDPAQAVARTRSRRRVVDAPALGRRDGACGRSTRLARDEALRSSCGNRRRAAPRGERLRGRVVAAGQDVRIRHARGHRLHVPARQGLAAGGQAEAVGSPTASWRRSPSTSTSSPGG